MLTASPSAGSDRYDSGSHWGVHWHPSRGGSDPNDCRWTVRPTHTDRQTDRGTLTNANLVCVQPPGRSETRLHQRLQRTCSHHPGRRRDHAVEGEEAVRAKCPVLRRGRTGPLLRLNKGRQAVVCVCVCRGVSPPWLERWW